MADRRSSTAPAHLPRGTLSRRDRPQSVDVTADEMRAFGYGKNPSPLTQHLRDTMRSVRVPPPAIPRDAQELAEKLRERDDEQRARHRDRDERARREYQEFLEGRPAGAPVYDDLNDEDEAPSERAREVRPSNARAVAALEREAGVDREDNRQEQSRVRSPIAQVKTHVDFREQVEIEKAARRDVMSRAMSRAVSREDALLTEDVDPDITDSPLTARLCTLADVDRLWDWVRLDADKGEKFLGKVFEHSQQLHLLMKTIADGEKTRASLARSLYYDDQHIGFGVLLPVLLREKMAGVHLYLRQEVRGELASFLPSLLSLAADVMPGVRLAVMDGAPSWAGMMAQAGFTMHTFFVKE